MRCSCAASQSESLAARRMSRLGVTPVASSKDAAGRFPGFWVRSVVLLNSIWRRSQVAGAGERVSRPYVRRLGRRRPTGPSVLTSTSRARWKRSA